MPKTFRALIALLILAVASLGGALYLAHEHDVRPDEALTDNASGFPSIELRALLGNVHGSDQTMLDNAFRQVERTYYKPVNAQTLLTGEQHELIAYLKAHAVPNPRLPVLIATGDQRRDIAALNRDLALAQARYGKQTSPVQLTQAAIRGMLSSLGDPYTTYLSPTQINSLEESLRGGDFGGIGVYMVQDPRTKAILVEPIEGMPAARAGVRTGDRITAVDGRPVAPLKVDDVERLIRGRTGTVVHLAVRRAGSAAPRTIA
ncbi:MAG: PDZ domain-containing protein, partial [Candidatus Eremiobacteraeota bacterium]|nr:PDZ domain-containing protein [Candidatus Eremiobacteraeota bacterium]